MNSKKTGGLFLVLATLFWAGNYVLGANAVHNIPPLSLVYLRWVMAVIPLFAIAWAIEHPSLKDILRNWPLLILLAALGLAGYNLLLYTALLHTSALNASLINAFNPALIVLAALIFLRQPIGLYGFLGLLLGLIGVLLVLTNGRIFAFFQLHYNIGDLLMLGAILCWTAYTILGRRLKKVPPITATAVQAAIVVLALTPIAFVTGIHFPTTQEAGLSLIFIALCPSVLSYVLWNLALTHINPGKAGIYLNLITVFTAIATIFMGIMPTWVQILGGILVLGGVFLTSRKNKVKV